MTILNLSNTVAVDFYNPDTKHIRSGFLMFTDEEIESWIRNAIISEVTEGHFFTDLTDSRHSFNRDSFKAVIREAQETTIGFKCADIVNGLAKTGSVAGKTFAALCYYFGLFVKSDLTKVRTWFNEGNDAKYNHTRYTQSFLFANGYLKAEEECKTVLESLQNAEYSHKEFHDVCEQARKEGHEKLRDALVTRYESQLAQKAVSSLTAVVKGKKEKQD